ncbi:MAG: hypothetical protein C0604_02000 [Clostridiales bacterium]|nr:MAG: hypothetical protein C0604_02000 [Clostridiales bacterium]
MKTLKMNALNFKLFIAVGILFCFNFIFVLGSENIADRIQVSLITFSPVLLALVLFSIKKTYSNKLTRLPAIMFIFTVNASTLLLYIIFAANTRLFTTVEGWMSSSLYLLILPIYTGIASLAVSLTTFLAVLIMQIHKKKINSK